MLINHLEAADSELELLENVSPALATVKDGTAGRVRNSETLKQISTPVVSRSSIEDGAVDRTRFPINGRASLRD